MLLSVGDRTRPGPAAVSGVDFDGSALGYLQAFHEFEYLTARITFLQGLIHWLGGVALTYAIPQPGDGTATRKMDKFVAASLGTLIVMILSFYNGHTNFYLNYAAMLRRFAVVAWTRYVWRWPPRPLFFVYVPAMVATLRYGAEAFAAEPDGD